MLSAGMLLQLFITIQVRSTKIGQLFRSAKRPIGAWRMEVCSVIEVQWVLRAARRQAHSKGEAGPPSQAVGPKMLEHVEEELR